MAEEDQYADEIDLKELLRSVFATKNWVIVSLVILTAGYWGFQTAMNFVKPTVHAYSSRVNLVFDGIEDGEYPNETSFSINDIISPAVLNTVYDRNNLNEFIRRKEFVSAFSVAPYAPDRQLILNKYRSRMDTRNLGSTELEELQQRLNDELRQATSDSAVITFSSTEADNIPQQMIEKIMREVPAEWAQHMVDDVGVLRFDAAMYSEKVVEEDLLASADYLIAFEILRSRVSLLKQNVEQIKQMPNGLVVVDEESGFSVPDLDKAISDIQRYRIGPLVNPVRKLGITRRAEVVELYFQNELTELQREKQLLQDKRRNVRRAYTDYASSGVGSRQQDEETSGGFGTGSMIPQFGSDFLDRIVEMTKANDDIAYRQKLNDEQLEISNDLADLDGEIERIEDTLAALRGTNDTSQEVREQYAGQIESELPVIVDQLKRYFQISNRLYDRLSRENLGGAGFIFRYADGQIDYSASRDILNQSNLRLYLILCFLAAVVVVPAVMIRNAMRS